VTAARVRLCQVPGCRARHKARGMCSPHYQVWWRGRRAPLVSPRPCWGIPSGVVHPFPSDCRRTHYSGRSGDVPPYGWSHLPGFRDADGGLPIPRDAVTWAWQRAVALPVLRDDRLPWWEVGLRAAWRGSLSADTERPR
jgi:hypothetical protein